MEKVSSEEIVLVCVFFTPVRFYGWGFYLSYNNQKSTYSCLIMNFIVIPIDLITSTPNNMELGSKVRELFFEHNSWTGDTEQQKPCIQETEDK